MSLGFTKILRDLWLNRARTSMVVLAIALSVMAFGVLNTTYTVVLYKTLSPPMSRPNRRRPS
jgi:hypothetical protein